MFDNWLGKSKNKKCEHRKPYYGAKAVDATCRNHGSDGWSLSDRLYCNLKRLIAADLKLKEYKGGLYDIP